jgi:hypothetical protein
VSNGSTTFHFPKTNLSRLVARSGGISRVAALDGALKNVESMRDQGDEVILRSMAEINVIIDASQPDGELSDANMADLLCRADQIVTLAESFGHELLDVTAKSLCDMVDGLLRAGRHNLAPIRVHVDALNMMMPGSATLSDAEFSTILAELSKVRDYFNITSIDNEHSGAIRLDVSAKPSAREVG